MPGFHLSERYTMCPAFPSLTKGTLGMVISKVFDASRELKRSYILAAPPLRETFLSRLSETDQKFLEQYLLAGFSIKQLEKNSSLGYAAIRSRLDKLIANYKTLSKMEDQKKAILEKLRTGEITVAQAKQRLERLSGG